MLKRIVVFTVFTVFAGLAASAQCDVRIHVPTKTICLGDTIPMEAKGGCGIAFFADFNDSTMQGLVSNTNQVIGTPCSSSPDSTYYLWMGTNAGQNLIYTPQLNLSAGGFYVTFEMKYGEDGASGICDGPSALSEAVHLQYSVNNGATWTDIQYWDPNGGHDPNLINWKFYSVSLPPAAQTANTRFRWTQLSSLPASSACWGIDNIIIRKNVPTQYVWSTGHYGSIHPPVSPLNTTKYYVTATSGSNSSVDSVTIVVLPRPTGDFVIKGPLCKNKFINFVYTGNGDSTALYHWTFDFAAQQLDTNKKNASALYNKSGQYTATLMVTQGTCSSVPNSKSFTVVPLISFYITTSQGCEPLEVTFTGNVEPKNASYFWDFHDGSTDTAVNVTHTYQKAGDYGLTLIAVTDSGCVDTVDFPVLTRVYPKPVVDFIHTPEIVPWSNPTAGFSDKSLYGNSYLWNFGDPASGNNSSTMKNPDHKFSAKGLYDVWLTVTSAYGCVDSAMKSIRVADDEFVVPNVITPNGDGINDVLKISNLESLKYCQIEIFNRWGKTVYISYDYKNNWDGEGVADGVYYYSIFYESWFGKGEIRGFFYVIR
jgi:gliding motility-associated-like protein